MWDDNWAASAACRDSQPDTLFVRGAAQNQAKAVCAGCPVRTECLAEALCLVADQVPTPSPFVCFGAAWRG